MALDTFNLHEQNDKLLDSSDTTAWDDVQKYPGLSRTRGCHIGLLYLLNVLLVLGIVVLAISKDNCRDPSLQTYCE